MNPRDLQIKELNSFELDEKDEYQRKVLAALVRKIANYEYSRDFIASCIEKDIIVLGKRGIPYIFNTKPNTPEKITHRRVCIDFFIKKHFTNDSLKEFMHGLSDMVETEIDLSDMEYFKQYIIGKTVK